MPRFRISLPDELRRDPHGTERRTGTETASRRLGDGIEGTDDVGQRVIRWFDCWVDGDD